MGRAAYYTRSRPPAPRTAGATELQRVCLRCAQKAQSARGLTQGTTVDNFHGYCRNTRTLATIFVEAAFNRL